jgi:hypothetical protein
MSQHFNPLVVTLTPQELAEAHKAASGRWQLSRAAGIANQRRAAQTDAEIDLLGIKAEIAVAKVLNCDYSPFHMGVDSGMDMWHGQASIDIKATFHGDGSLLFKSREAFKADCAILATKTDDEAKIRIIGGCSRQRFMREAENVNLGHGPCWIIQQQDLSPIEAVWRILTEERYK